MSAASSGTSSSASRIAILGTRRAGVAGLLSLLGSCPAVRRIQTSGGACAENALRAASRTYHGSGEVAAASALRQSLRQTALLACRIDEDSADFNSVLARELEAAEYRCVLMLRRPDADCLFSGIVCTHYGIGTRAQVAALRERLSGGEPPPEFHPRWVRGTVRANLASHAWLVRLATDGSPARLAIDFDALFRDGVGALPLLDAVFEHLRLGERRHTLSDATVLQAIFRGAHHAESLRSSAAALERLYMQIRDELDFVATSPGTA